jgi:hypothetical protein
LVIDQACIVGGSGTTPTAGFHLHFNTLVGDLQHATGAIEQQSTEVGDEPERIHIDTKVIDNGGEFIALLDRVKLHFITDHEIKWHVLACERDKAGGAADVDGW